MGKYDNLLKEAGEEDTTSLGKSKYSTLLAEAGDDEPEQMTQYKPAPVESNNDGYFSKINKAMDDRALEGAMKNLKPEKYPMQHAVQNLNTLVGIPMAGASKALDPVKPYLKSAAKGLLEGAAFAGGARKGNFDNSSETIGKVISPVIQKYDEVKQKYPVVGTVGEFIGEVGELAGNVAGIFGAAKIGALAGNGVASLPSKTGDALKDVGTKFKLGDMKIKDSIAKKGYGKDLINKKENIVNTIYDYGLTTGGNKGGYEKAGEIISGIHNKADDITVQLAADPNIKLKNPVKIARDNLDIQSLPAGKRKKAQAIADEIVAELTDEGLDGNLTVDKLIQAKRSIDTNGLFTNGPGLSGDDILDNAVRKKMYLSLTNEISDISPELKALNTEAKKLYDAQDALAAAASRTANKDAISLTDWIMGASAVVDPKALPVLALKKGLAGGRGSNLVLNVARGLKGDKIKSIDDILNSLPKKPPIDRRTIAELPSDVLQPAYFRKGVLITEKGNRLVTEKDLLANLRRDFDVIDPTTIDKLDRWDIKGKPIEGIDRSTSKVIDPTTINRIGLDENELLQLKKLASLR